MEFIRKLLGAIFDLRAIVGLAGLVLSVVSHELFHLMVHWTELQSIHIFPDSEAIIEIIFTPTTGYNLALEEALAYAVTMTTLILTALLVSDVHDTLYHTPGTQKVLHKEFSGCYRPHEEQRAREQLARLLGLPSAT